MENLHCFLSFYMVSELWGALIGCVFITQLFDSHHCWPAGVSLRSPSQLVSSDLITVIFVSTRSVDLIHGDFKQQRCFEAVNNGGSLQSASIDNPSGWSSSILFSRDSSPFSMAISDGIFTKFQGSFFILIVLFGLCQWDVNLWFMSMLLYLSLFVWK